MDNWDGAGAANALHASGILWRADQKASQLRECRSDCRQSREPEDEPTFEASLECAEGDHGITWWDSLYGMEPALDVLQCLNQPPVASPGVLAAGCTYAALRWKAAKVAPSARSL